MSTGIDHLKSVKTHRLLELRKCDLVTKEAAKRLAELLPECNVVYLGQ
jgi:hypothetical protein